MSMRVVILDFVVFYVYLIKNYVETMLKCWYEILTWCKFDIELPMMAIYMYMLVLDDKGDFGL